MTYLFKVCINVDDPNEALTFLSTMDQYLCLSDLMPHHKLGLCLGVVEYEIDGDRVILALFMVNDELTKPWIRKGGILLDINDKSFENQLFTTAKGLWSNIKKAEL